MAGVEVEREMGAKTLHVGEREYGIAVVDYLESNERHVYFSVSDPVGRNERIVHEHVEAIPD